MATAPSSQYRVRSLVSELLSFWAILTCGAGDGFGPSLKDRDNASTSRRTYQQADVGAVLQTLSLHRRHRGGQEYYSQSIAQDRDSSATGPKAEVKSMQQVEAADIWITKPSNDTTLPVGNVLVSFETLGFDPSMITPIEVLVPQNGDVPALLENGNAVNLLVDRPCTQLVILSATAGGRRVSTSVLFSTLDSEATVMSSRVPLPADAAWGVSRILAPFKEPLYDASRNPLGLTTTSGVEGRVGGEQGEASDGENPNRYDAHSLGGIAGPSRSTIYLQDSPRPLTILFVGSLTWDGQKHIWLQQMERLPRQRFEPKFLTFQETADESGGAVSWRTTTVEKFKNRLYAAGAPLIEIPAPLLQFDLTNIDRTTQGGGLRGNDGDCSSNMTERSIPVPIAPVKETVFKLVLESFDRAGGRPHLMDPPWTRDVFGHITGAIRGISPDILAFANGRTLGDAVLTRAARLAMHERSRIVMDFPNINPAQGIDADVLVTPSHYVSRHPAVKALAEKAGADVVVIPPGVDVSPISVDTMGLYGYADLDNLEWKIYRRYFGNDTSAPVIGYAGRLAPEKGPGLFLAVAAEITKRLPSVSFILAGDGPLRSALEAMAARLGITRRVHFVGWKDGPDLQRLMKNMDLLFNPSLASSETFCVVNIEAMGAGTPVAAFGIGGMLEYMTPGVNALVLDDPDPRGVATAIVEALLDPGRMKALAERARADIVNNFRSELALERWAQLYEALHTGWESRQAAYSEDLDYCIN